MKYSDFEYVLSAERTSRYLRACGGNSRNAMTLYRYNHELDKVNKLRNRIAHHEPICFLTGQDVVYTDYIKKEYQNIQTLFSWMGINGKSMLYGLDHVLSICDKIDVLFF